MVSADEFGNLVRAFSMIVKSSQTIVGSSKL